MSAKLALPIRLLSIVGCFLALTAPVFAEADGWPHLRGPSLDGRLTTDGVFASDSLGLEVAWKAALGPAYSGISIVDDIVVTFYSDGESDLAVALDAGSGEELWSYRIDSVYRGHDGSSDGPLSTPTIADGVVYGLGARGQLFALRLSDGQPQWLRQLSASYGSEEPHFGYTSTPIVVGDVLVVQTGGDGGQSVVGVDRRTGDTLWKRGDDKVEYQSPTLIDLGGRSQVVAVGNRVVAGLDAASGDILWQHELAEGDRVNSAHPTPAGDDRFLIFVSGAAAVFEVKAADAGFDVSELYRSRELGGTYALPVYHDGHFYGFRGQFLTCIDATTGEKVWKSRPPGGRGLILVDDKLVIFGGKGNVVVTEATAEGYRETARVQAFEGSAYTWPSFADGKIYVRNLEEIAAISVTGGSAAASMADSGDHAFGRFVSQLETADDKTARITEFLTANENLPVVEDSWVHFVFHGEAEDIALEANFIEDGTDGLERVAGTDFFHRSYQLEPATRWEYRFVKDLSDRMTDPHNSRTVPATRGDVGFSELVLDGYELPTHLGESKNPGRIETVKITGEKLDMEREVRVYLPAGYDGGKAKYPLFVVLGLEWVNGGRMETALDNLIGQSVEPVVVAFVAPQGQWWRDGGGSDTDLYADLLAKELVPFLEEKYRLESSADSRVLMGSAGFGLTAAYGALKHADVFSRAAVGSVHLGAGYGDALMELIAQPEKPDVDFMVAWLRWDVRRHAGGLDYRGDSEKLAQALKDHGYDTSGGEYREAHGLGAAWSLSDDLLESLFPIAN